jgi:hypothetical protein
MEHSDPGSTAASISIACSSRQDMGLPDLRECARTAQERLGS